MRGVEARALIELRREWLAAVEAWAADEDTEVFTTRRLADEVKRLRRQLGVVRTVEERRAATRERVRRHRERHRAPVRTERKGLKRERTKNVCS
jgi:hypothetical protein